MKNNKKGIAIVPGSFDPITIGHIDIVKRAAEDHDKVYLAVMINNSKKYMFSMDQRVQIAKAAVKDISKVEVISSDGMLWQLAEKLKADHIVKGYRNDIDLQYENDMARFNKEHYPKAETVLLKANEAMVNISSTLLREKIKNGEKLDNILPEGAKEEINKIIKEQMS